MTQDARLFPYALFGATLAAAGLPIYIHAPKFFVDTYGISLTTIGAILFGLRLLDVVQDPALGWLSRKLRGVRGTAVGVACALMAIAMLGLFAVTPPLDPALWFAVTLALLFSSFSFLTISFYAQGVTRAEALGDNGHVRLAGWRETGALAGVSLAAMAPVALSNVTEMPFAIFAICFAVLVAIAAASMAREWRSEASPSPTSFRNVIGDHLSRRLLLIAFLNAAPVAVTSTLFLFFVESRLAAPGWEGPLLLLFFVSAAVSAPVWSRVAREFSAKQALLIGMCVSIAAFGWAAFLGPGDLVAFTVICIVSGIGLGADMTLLPALFAARSREIAPDAAEGFGLWSFVSKASLAVAAVVLLPMLEASGFQSGQTDLPEAALMSLSIMYAALPCALKLIALGLLAATHLDEAHMSPKLREV